jgi:trk system potassium uptake protein TrkH
LQLTPGRFRGIDRWAGIASWLLIIVIILGQGYQLRPLLRYPVSQAVAILLVVLVIARLLLDALATPHPRPFFKAHWLELVLLGLMAVTPITFWAIGSLLALRVLVRAGSRILTSPSGRSFLVGVAHSPARTITTSFLGAIAGGTLLLTFPGASASGESAPLLTALFTSTSAVCVTGLTVVDTPTYWSTFGQWVIVLLIQVGGLGIMSLSAATALVFGRSFGASSRGLLEEAYEETAKRDITRLLQFIVAFTFGTELVGAALLALHWSRHMPLLDALYHGLFHSVSAFCNAGFSTFSDNLAGWVSDPLVTFVITFLIIIGGIGFTVGMGLMTLARHPLHPVRWWRHERTHTKLVLTVTAFLIVGGTIAFFFFDYENSLSGLPLGSKLLAAYFQSVTSRTAGFNTVNLGAAAPITATIVILLMFIGGSPGSTAGGIKTTTLGILVLSLRALLRGRRDVEVFGRRIPDETLLRAVSVTLMGGTLLALGAMGLFLFETGKNYLDLLFESVSAFGTVGLSRGITPSLTPMGQLIIITLMFVGRTGPLTLAFAAGKSGARTFYRYPDGKILVG